ncbi:MAG: hypothetical protein WC777_01035 [Candidatus Gracilibacteria bacterium]|jgi:hypothetical protein
MATEKDKNPSDEPIAPEAFDEVVLGWMAPEFVRYARGWLWFTLLILISASLVAYGYWTHSISMMVVFVVLPLVLILEHRKKPKAVEVILSPYGVKFGVLRMPYSALKGFAVLHNPPHTDELHLMTKKKSRPEVVIPLMGVNPSLVRQFLATQVQEQESKELSLLDAIVRILRLN